MAQRARTRTRRTGAAGRVQTSRTRAVRRSRVTMDAVRDWLNRRVDLTFRFGNWAATGPSEAFKDVTAEIAHHRHPGEHTIAEQVLHMAYWKDAVTARLRDRAWAYDDAMNWRSPAPGEAGWAAAREELRRAHRRLMAAIRSLPAARLLEVSQPGRPHRLLSLLVDVATHDTYHAAQIFILKRLAMASPRT